MSRFFLWLGPGFLVSCLLVYCSPFCLLTVLPPQCLSSLFSLPSLSLCSLNVSCLFIFCCFYAISPIFLCCLLSHHSSFCFLYLSAFISPCLIFLYPLTPFLSTILSRYLTLFFFLSCLFSLSLCSLSSHSVSLLPFSHSTSSLTLFSLLPFSSCPGTSENNTAFPAPLLGARFCIVVYKMEGLLLSFQVSSPLLSSLSYLPISALFLSLSFVYPFLFLFSPLPLSLFSYSFSLLYIFLLFASLVSVENASQLREILSFNLHYWNLFLCLR